MLSSFTRRVFASTTRLWSRKLSQETVQSGENEFKESTSLEDSDDISRFLPPQDFLASLDEKRMEIYQKTLKEFELYIYLASYIPQRMTATDWNRSMNLKSIGEKVSFWEYVALTNRRQMRKDNRQSKYKARSVIDPAEVEKYENGGMGYGPGLYELVKNPLRAKERVRNLEGCRVFHSMQIDAPKIAFDLQFIAGYPNRVQSELGNQVQYTISANYQAARPFQFSFVNSSPELTESWLEKSVGFYQSDKCETILPDFSPKGVKEVFNQDKDIIYISKHANDVLDGPLSASVVAICVTMDLKKETMSAARRARIRAVRLPIHKYVKWAYGPQFLPLPNLVNVLRQVNSSGGDWRTALLNNISKRHLESEEGEEQRAIHAMKRKQKSEQKKELIEAIANAAGQSPV